MRPLPRIVYEVELSDRLQPTARELDVLWCAARGLDNRETARELHIAPQTVKFHRTGLFQKLGARSIAHAVSIGYQRGLLYLEGEPLPVVVLGGVRYVLDEAAA